MSEDKDKEKADALARAAAAARLTPRQSRVKAQKDRKDEKKSGKK